MGQVVLLIIAALCVIMIGQVIKDERDRRTRERIAREQMDELKMRHPWKK